MPKTKQLPTAQAAEIKEHRAAWGEIQRAIGDKELSGRESLCATVVRLIRERNALLAALNKTKKRFMA